MKCLRHWGGGRQRQRNCHNYLECSRCIIVTTVYSKPKEKLWLWKYTSNQCVPAESPLQSRIQLCIWYTKGTDRNKYAVEFKKYMGKYVKTYLRGYHASGLVNNIPYLDVKLLFLHCEISNTDTICSLKHCYLPLSVAQKSHKTTHKHCCKNLKFQERCGPTHGTWLQIRSPHYLIPNLDCPAVITLPLSLLLHVLIFCHYSPFIT